MKYPLLIKNCLKLAIACDLNPVTIITRCSKDHVYNILDKYIPDERAGTNHTDSIAQDSEPEKEVPVINRIF